MWEDWSSACLSNEKFWKIITLFKTFALFFSLNTNIFPTKYGAKVIIKKSKYKIDSRYIVIVNIKDRHIYNVVVFYNVNKWQYKIETNDASNSEQQSIFIIDSLQYNVILLLVYNVRLGCIKLMYVKGDQNSLS